MLSPGAKGRFRRSTTNLSEARLKLSNSTPTGSSNDLLDSPRMSPKTPRGMKVIPEEAIERVKRMPSGASGCKLWVARVNGWSCCLKEISLESAVKHDVEEFEKEVRVLSTLAQPIRGLPTHLVQFLGCQRSDLSGGLQLFMTLYEGNLKQVLDSLRSLDTIRWLEETRLARYVSQVLKGLNILHHRNIIHRDIKSPNIFYSALERWDGTPRPDSPRNGLLPESLVLGDFGEAKILHHMSRAKTCRGTPSWIPPEVLEAATTKLEYTLAADIWSLGMVVYEMMTLTQPYSDLSPLRVICCVQEGILPTLEAVFYRRYPRVTKIWHQMVSINPADRPKVGELLKLFLEIASSPIAPKDAEASEEESSLSSDLEEDLEEESSTSSDSSTEPIIFL